MIDADSLCQLHAELFYFGLLLLDAQSNSDNP